MNENIHTAKKQLKIVQGARSVKGIYFTMQKFAFDHNPGTTNPTTGEFEVGELVRMMKKDIELEAYRQMALDYLAPYLEKENAPTATQVPEPLPLEKVEPKSKKTH